MTEGTHVEVSRNRTSCCPGINLPFREACPHKQGLPLLHFPVVSSTRNSIQSRPQWVGGRVHGEGRAEGKLRQRRDEVEPSFQRERSSSPGAEARASSCPISQTRSQLTWDEQFFSPREKPKGTESHKASTGQHPA